MRTKICHLKSKPECLDQQLTVKGWVRTVRDLKTFAFIELNDGSCLSNLQVVVPSSIDLSQVTTGSSIAVKGKLIESPGKNQSVELQACELSLLGPCPADSYPLQKKRHSFEFLRTIAHLRPRTNTLGAIARVRNHLAHATHTFFQEQGFLYVHTPIITSSDCEGAGELFRVTTLDASNPPRDKEGKADLSKDFFGKSAYLTVSGQLNGEIYACALSDIYTFGPTFRAENSNTSRHLAEFWMIEPEMAFANLEDDMVLAESYIQFIYRSLLNHCQEDLAFFDQFIQKGILSRLQAVTSEPFARITYDEAVRILLACKESFQFPVTWGSDLQSEHERYLCEKHFNKPVIVYNYPASIKPFYMKLNSDEKTVANMDVLVPGVGEIIGGSQREEQYDVLKQRMIASQMDMEPYQWYLDLRQYGTVEHAGFGAGFERLIQFATGMENIRDVIPFPRYPGHAAY